MSSSKIGSYELTTTNQSFYALIEKKSSRKWSVIVGGRKKGCIVIDITQYESITEGVLNVSYDQECNTTGTMLKGVGTLTMLQAAIQFAFNTFSKMSVIYLLDHSHVKCGDLDMYLPPIELAKYGKTWYERKIGAKLEDTSKQNAIDKYIHICTQQQNWHDFWKTIEPIFKRQQRYNIILNTSQLKMLIQDYFILHNGNLRKMISAIKNDQGCKIFVGWLEAYFNQIIKISFKDLDYIIVPGSFEPIDMTINFLKENPYLKDLKERKKTINNKMDLFSSFIPRSTMQSGGKTYGTYFTFGPNTKLDEIE